MDKVIINQNKKRNAPRNADIITFVQDQISDDLTMELVTPSPHDVN